MIAADSRRLIAASSAIPQPNKLSYVESDISTDTDFMRIHSSSPSLFTHPRGVALSASSVSDELDFQGDLYFLPYQDAASFECRVPGQVEVLAVDFCGGG